MMFQEDRAYIENKYHKVDEPFNPFARMAYHGYAYDESTGLEDAAIQDGLRALAPRLRELPHPVAKAYAVKYVLENTKIDVSAHDWFVGLWSVGRLSSCVTFEPWYREVFEDKLKDTAGRMKEMNDSGAVAIWPDFDHVVPDWDSILSLGFSGLAARAAAYKAEGEAHGRLSEEKAAFYDGIILTYTAIVALIDRLYAYAIRQTHPKAQKIAQCLGSIRDGAPQNIYEAMQVIYLYFMVSECFDGYQVRSLGNGLDNSLLRFYENDLKNGTYTEAEIREFFRYFLLQWSAIGNYWGQPFYMGGTKADGSTKYNALSYLILDVYDELEIYNPKIQLKVNTNTPDELLCRAFSMLRRGHSSLVFCCEEGMMRAVMQYGATADEAREMDIRGCYETGVRANEVSTGTGYVNALKAVEYVFSNGYDAALQKQFGPATGSPNTLRTFADFYHAVLRQWENLIEMTIDVSRDFEAYLGYINPSNMYSGTIVGSLEKGVDAYQSGVKFNNSAILNCSFAGLVDAVMAVKEWVYDKEEITLTDLGQALAANWQGYETLHTKILKSSRKYGNNEEETDRYTAALSSFFASRVNNRPNARGGVYKAIMHSARQFIEQGKKTGATPDGRYAGQEISKNASPTPGMDRNGVTALLNSALTTMPYTYMESHCVDVMLHPSAIDGEGGYLIFKSLLFTYMRGGGQSIQFNIFDSEMLRAAQKDPAHYQNLQVRVCGWNVLWNNLSREEQEAYMARAAHIV